MLLKLTLMAATAGMQTLSGLSIFNPYDFTLSWLGPMGKFPVPGRSLYWNIGNPFSVITNNLSGLCIYL